MDKLNAATVSKKFMDELTSRIKNGEPIDSMLSQYSPTAIRDILEEAQGVAAGNKNPLDLFEKPELIKSVPVNEIPNLADHGEAYFYKNGAPAKINVRNLDDKGTLIHELQHAYDAASQPSIRVPTDISDNPSLKALQQLKSELDINRPIKSVSDLKGLEETTQFLSNHFKPDVVEGTSRLKQLINLERIMKGEPLKSIAAIAAPVAKGLGLAGAGLAAASIGNKAMAGDYSGAATDAVDLGTDLTPGVSEAKMALMPSDIGSDESIEDPSSDAFKRRLDALNKLRNQGSN